MVASKGKLRELHKPGCTRSGERPCRAASSVPHSHATKCRLKAADPPSADPLSVTSTCRCSNAPVFPRTRHMLL